MKAEFSLVERIRKRVVVVFNLWSQIEGGGRSGFLMLSKNDKSFFWIKLFVNYIYIFIVDEDVKEIYFFEFKL